MKPAHPALRIRNIVFPTDGSGWADHALDQAAFYAAHLDAVLHVLTVRLIGEDVPETPPPARGVPEWLDPPSGLGFVASIIDAQRPEEGIIDYATRIDADLIVMATHGRKGLSHWLGGSVAESVVRHARCPVLTTGPGVVEAQARAQRILVPVDFSKTAYLAGAHASALARLHGAAVDLLHVVETQLDPGLPGTVVGWGAPAPHQLADAREALVEFAAEVDIDDVPISYHVVRDGPAGGILDAAVRFGADLIVAGSHGRTGLRRLLLGSVAERLVQQAPCPVFVVKAFGKSLLDPATAFTGAEWSPRS